MKQETFTDIEYSFRKKKKKSQLEEVIEKFNEHYAGEITPGDRILAGILMEKMSNDDGLRKSAQQDGEQIFTNSFFLKHMTKRLWILTKYLQSRSSVRKLHLQFA